MYLKFNDEHKQATLPKLDEKKLKNYGAKCFKCDEAHDFQRKAL
jgi:hypothetical protein